MEVQEWGTARGKQIKGESPLLRQEGVESQGGGKDLPDKGLRRGRGDIPGGKGKEPEATSSGGRKCFLGTVGYTRERETLPGDQGLC